MKELAERVERLLPAVLFLVGFGAYLLCVGPWTGWLDSGELLTGAHHLGVSHPPGQPTYSLCAKTLLLLPAGGIAFRGALLSVVAGAACWPLVYGLTLALIHAASPGGRSRDPWAPLLAAATAVAFGFLGPTSLESTRAEVYILTLALLLAALRLLLEWKATGDARTLPLAALTLGLAAGAHPLLAVVVLAVGLAFTLLTVPRSAPQRLGRVLGASGSALLLGAAVFLLLPIRAAAGADFAWGDPQTWPRFLSTASGAPYAGTYAGGGDPLWDRLVGHLELLEKHLGWEMGLLAVVGLGLLLYRSWRAGALVWLALLGAFGTAVAQRVFYAANPDVSGYLLLTLALLLAGTALVIGIEGPRRLPPRLEAAVAVLGAALVVGATPFGLTPADGHAETYVRAVLEATPARALLVARSDHADFPLTYAQRVEGERPDVRVAIGPLLGSSWYLRTLKRWAPDLFVPYVDDGQLGPLEARLIEGNARERPVVLEPVGGDGRDLGLLSLLAGAAPPGTDALETWRRFLALERPAELTRRVLGFAAQARASRLADRGQLGAAAAEILATFGVDGSWLQVWEALVRRRLAPIPAFPAWRPMAGSVLRFSRTFLSSTGQAAWHLGDLLFALGLPGLGSFWLDLSATPEAALARALWALRLGDEAELEHSLARLGDRARDGRIAAARAGQTEGRFAAALTVLRPLLTADDPAALALAGVLEAERGDPGAGERLLRRSLEKRPQAIEALTNLGLVYAKQGRFAEARAVWEQASRDPAAHRARALLEKLRAERR